MLEIATRYELVAKRAETKGGSASIRKDWIAYSIDRTREAVAEVISAAFIIGEDRKGWSEGRERLSEGETRRFPCRE